MVLQRPGHNQATCTSLHLQHSPQKWVRWWQFGPHHITAEGRARTKEANLVTALRNNRSLPRKPTCTFRTTQTNMGVHDYRGVSTPALTTSAPSLGPCTDFNQTVSANLLPGLSAVSSAPPQSAQPALWTTSQFCWGIEAVRSARLVWKAEVPPLQPTQSYL